MHEMMWLHRRNITNHFHILPLCRVSGWIRRVSVQWINFPTRVRLRFTGLFLQVSDLRLWNCLTALVPVWRYATNTDFELAIVCH